MLAMLCYYQDSNVLCEVFCTAAFFYTRLPYCTQQARQGIRGCTRMILMMGEPQRLSNKATKVGKYYVNVLCNVHTLL